MKIIFAGTPEVAVPSLEKLCETDGIEVAAVITRPDAPVGRGRKLKPSPVKTYALENGISVIEISPRDPDFIEAVNKTGAQAAAVVAYGHILTQKILDCLPLGWYNLHFSLLPQWRGAAPVQRAVWAGDEMTGTTVFKITAGMDSGPILGQTTAQIGPHDTSGDMFECLAKDGAQLLALSMKTVADGTAKPVEQPGGAYEKAEKINVEDSIVRFDVPAFAADRQIRACTPAPGARTAYRPDEKSESIKIIITKAQIATEEEINKSALAESLKNLTPGQIIADKKHVWAGTATLPLEILAVKPQGKKEMRAADWARGARISEGACFG